MKNKKLTILMAEFMNVELAKAHRCDTQLYFGDGLTVYNPFKNSAQMNAFIEHPDVMMSVVYDYERDCYIASIYKKHLGRCHYTSDKSRTTAINECAAAFFGEEYEV